MILQIVGGGGQLSAADAFKAFYRVRELKRIADAGHWPRSTRSVVPTAPATYTVDELLADPVTLNSRLGTYTNFVNLLDLCGLAVPVIAECGRGSLRRHAARRRRAGICNWLRSALHSMRKRLEAWREREPRAPLRAASPALQGGEIAIAVVGAHLSGMPLNGELRALNARLLRTTTTAADYRLFALRGTVPPKPGLMRVEHGAGARIALEIWALTADGFGQFVNNIPPPMAIGTVRLDDGSEVKGFVAEPAAFDGARDISEFGGWRAFIQQAKATA